MTFIYELDPYSLEVYRMCVAYMNFLHQGFRKLSSDRQTDRQTDTTEVIYHVASWVVNNNNENMGEHIIRQGKSDSDPHSVFGVRTPDPEEFPNLTAIFIQGYICDKLCMKVRSVLRIL